MAIHSTAIIGDNVRISEDVDIGPYVIVEPHVTIGKGVKIFAHSYICSNTEIGDATIVHMGAVLGNMPQDIQYDRSKTFLKIGRNNTIREHVTIHRGTKEGSATVIGDNNFFMASSHVGHNCCLGNGVILANGVLLAGYVTVEDAVFIGGNVVIHQFCRIGKIAMIGGFSGVNKDVPPYVSVRGPSVVWGINLVGMRRAKLAREAIRQIKDAYQLVYQSGLNTEQAIMKVLETNPCGDVTYFLDFIKNSKRGICKYKFKSEDKEFYNNVKVTEKTQ